MKEILKRLTDDTEIGEHFSPDARHLGTTSRRSGAGVIQQLTQEQTLAVPLAVSTLEFKNRSLDGMEYVCTADKWRI
jgi:hypothetical protein